MKPGIYNIEIEQGATYHKTFTVLDGALDLSTYAGVRMKIRRMPGSHVIWDSTNVATGSIAIDGSNKVVLNILATATAAMDFSEAHYDVELYKNDDPETVDKLIKGKVVLNKETTY